MGSEPIETTFTAIWERCRNGDLDAQHELLQKYEPDLVCCVRVHLRDPSLRRIADSTDICQTVVRRLIAGMDNYEFDSYSKFQALVSRLVQNQVIKMRSKLINQQRAEREATELKSLGTTSPSNEVEASDIHEFARRHMTGDEWNLFESVSINGMRYTEVAQSEGATADALRKRLNRIKARIREMLDGEPSE